MAAQRDYYEVLGVARDADAKAIKDAFRALARQYHPDVNKQPGAEEKFKEIAGAYAVLSDPDKRKAYDDRGFAGVAGFTPDELFRDIDFGDLLGGLGFELGGAGGGGLFERFFGGRRRGPPRGRDLEVVLEIPLSRVVTGGEEQVSYARSSPCGACRGTGAKDGTKLHRCAACGGSGTKAQESRRREPAGEVLIRNLTPCADCAGRGEIVDEVCSTCRGRRTVEETRSLSVKIPVGVEEGMILRVPGHGMESEVPGGVAGDLLVVVRTAPDARFERHDADLWRRERVTVPEAVLGVQRTIPTLDGDVELTIPAGTQPDVVLRLAGKGVPVLGGRTRGDLYVGVEVVIPDHPSKRERALYEELGVLEAQRAHHPKDAQPKPRRRSVKEHAP